MFPCRSLVELHRTQAERLGPRPALRFTQHGMYRDLSWDRYRADSLACAAALIEAGIAPGDRVGLLSENRYEWLIADLGILAAAAVNVPPHAPLTAKQIHYQLHNAGCMWLFVSTLAQFEKIRPILAELPTLRGVVLFDSCPSVGLGVQTWAGFLQRGRRAVVQNAAELVRRETDLAGDSLATIMYTSGTTGNPKGVMLTHANVLSNVLATLESEPSGFDDVRLGWLPYSHIYARTLDHYLSIAAGNVLALAESVETLVTNLREIQPTHMNSVPRFYEKVLTAESAATPEETGRRLRRVFGPRMRWLCSGGAPLPVAVAEAYRAAGVLLLQGYGLTESSPVISFNRTTRHKIDSVGPPLPNVEVRIGADGEVLSRGPHIMKGYWNNPQATAEALEDGWLHTGDLGRLDEDGFLYITGRKKELLVMSSGKKVVPNHIEGLLLADPCIDQVVVSGEGRNFLTAIVVPHWDNLRRELGIEGRNEALCEHPAVEALLRRRIDAALTDVASWEQVKKFVVLAQPFSVAAEELTVSLKLRRSVIVQNHREELEALYRD
ncbi:MAG: AMP-dependent synthetase/ligase [Gemmataceae bacterium]|nr:AMP-dependent synthetase/ligase [Gemmataceae bacterium]